MKRMVIAGGSGYLGKCLAGYFSNKGYKIVILSRKHRLDTEKVQFVKWDAKSRGVWCSHLEGIDVLINLTGKSVDCRYTESNKQSIYDSRIDSTFILGEVVKTLSRPPKVWINASSATIYRHAMDHEMDEEHGETGNGFSVDVCKKWEQTFNDITLESTRKVILRTAIVLGQNGGALMPILSLTRVGLGGKQGSGRQMFSWLHEADFVRIVEYVIVNDRLSGVLNASAPNPVRNAEIMRHVRKSLRVPFGLPMPAWLLEIGAVLIKTETELILKSRWVVPRRLIRDGFRFNYSFIEEALENLLDSRI